MDNPFPLEPGLNIIMHTNAEVNEDEEDKKETSPDDE